MDEATLKGIVDSLRMYLDMIPSNERSRHIENIKDIAYAKSSGTKALIALHRMD